MKFERRHEPLLPGRRFLVRMVRYFLWSSLLIGASLLVGMVGYHAVAGLSWVDSLTNAAFILTGMGPVDPMRTTASKVFASGYALFSGVVFITAVGVLLAPALHRLLHHFHLELGGEPGRRRSGD